MPARSGRLAQQIPVGRRPLASKAAIRPGLCLQTGRGGRVARLTEGAGRLGCAPLEVP